MNHPSGYLMVLEKRTRCWRIALSLDFPMCQISKNSRRFIRLPHPHLNSRIHRARMHPPVHFSIGMIFSQHQALVLILTCTRHAHAVWIFFSCQHCKTLRAHNRDRLFSRLSGTKSIKTRDFINRTFRSLHFSLLPTAFSKNTPHHNQYMTRGFRFSLPAPSHIHNLLPLSLYLFSSPHLLHQRTNTEHPAALLTVASIGGQFEYRACISPGQITNNSYGAIIFRSGLV